MDSKVFEFQKRHKKFSEEEMERVIEMYSKGRGILKRRRFENDDSVLIVVFWEDEETKQNQKKTS